MIRLRAGALRWMIAIVPLVVAAQQMTLYSTSRAGARISPRPAIEFTNESRSGMTFHIDDKRRYQIIQGFGASFLEAGMICLRTLVPADQEALLRSLFDPRSGAGFTAMKTVLAATDFMPAGPFYSYDDHPGDTEMKQFSIERDLGPNGLIPYIKRARRYGRFVLQAPMDYPPDWMLSDINGKQDVDAQYFPALARYYLWYLREYQRHGVFVDYISLFNEPGGYTKIPPEKIRDLLKGYVGPLFAQEHLKTRIQACEPVTRDSAYRQWTVILQDPAARKYVSAVAYHGYHFRDYDKIAALHEQHPDLPLWLTEIDHSYNTDTKLPAVLPRRDYEDGDFWGNQLFNDLETGTSAWIYWNMILDEKGGPWLVSPIHHDPEFNAQHPVVIVDRRNRTVFYTALYYYLTHFSRFVRPGAVRIGTSGSAEKVRCMAFRDNDGRNIVELLNSRQEDILVNVESHGSIAQIELPALSITTALWKQAAPPTRSQAFHTKSTHASGR